MHCLTVFLLCLVASLTLSNSISRQECDSVCLIYCKYGNVVDEKGCPICRCKESPCEDGQAPLDGYFCGRGSDRRECPTTHHCMIAPNDAFAVCCPRQRQVQKKSI
jgi:hypothetical protein